MSRTINWGIIGCGRIAAAFAEGLKSLPDAGLTAAASRTEGKAKTFCKKFFIPGCHETYDAIVNDPDVDVIYVATTHNFHFDHARLALEHGKHVLCEKAFTLNAGQAEILIETARKHNRFLMEAMWTRFLPCTRKLLELLAGGIIGEVRLIKADLCKKFPRDPQDRFFNLNLGGGSLLDLGVYPISFAGFIFGGTPADIHSAAHIGATGVDEQAAYLLFYDGGRHAVLSSSLVAALPPDAYVTGGGGYIHVPHFTRPTRFHVYRNESQPETIEMPYESSGLNYEAAEVMRCIRAGKLESEVLPLRETLETMKMMDHIRSQWDLKYPDE